MKDQESSYRIGAVARLTGIPPDTLRVWERRYDLVQPSRSEGGGRLYSHDDVTRLTLIKRLVDSGQAIGTIAELTLEQLHARIAETRLSDQGATLDRPIRLAIQGATLPQRFRTDLEFEQGKTVDLVASFRSVDEVKEAADSLNVDALLIELPTLESRSAPEIRELSRSSGASRTLVVYGFASRHAVAQLEGQGFTTLRFPVTWEEIRAILGTRIQPPPQAQADDLEAGLLEEPPDRLYDDEQLALALTVSTAIKCECPRHLADLTLSLCQFEEYSARCEHQNREDAALHAYLHVTTAKARAMMEQALRKVIEVEGIELEGRSAEESSQPETG